MSSTPTQKADAFITQFDAGLALSAPTIKHDERVIIFPNPTSSIIQILQPEGFFKNYQVEIFNTIGQLVYKTNESKNTIINVGEFASGVYLLKINADGLCKTAKFVKE